MIYYNILVTVFQRITLVGKVHADGKGKKSERLSCKDVWEQKETDKLEKGTF